VGIPLIYKQFNVNDTLKITQYALQNAREHKSVVEFSHMDYSSQQKLLWRYEIEWHRKYALAFACLLLFFIGAPLGAIIRKGGIGIPLVASILIFVFYWVVSTIGERMSRLGLIPTSVGMWVASAILLPLGIFLIYKASKESRLFDLESWQKFIMKIKKLKIFGNSSK